MQISKTPWTLIATLLLIAAAWWLITSHTTSPVNTGPATASTTPITSSTTQPVAATSTAAVGYRFPLNAADHITSWSYKGGYSGNATLVAQAQADITHLKSLLGKGQYDDYDLYIGIGNDYDLMGDGASAYAAYNKSVSIHPTKGLAFTNLGQMFDEMGAYNTAADAYAKAVAVEPSVLVYQLDRLRFLTSEFPNNNAMLVAAFTDASNQFGDTAEVLAIEAQWLTGQKRYADAIAAWQRAKLLSPGKDTSAIDAEIARLQAKQ